MNNTLVTEIKNLSTNYDISLSSLKNLVFLFSQMHDKYKDYLKTELINLLGLTNKDYTIPEIIQMLNWEQINNVTIGITQFSKFPEPDTIERYHKILDICENHYDESKLFLFQISFIYLITLFKEYIKDILDKVFVADQSLKSKAENYQFNIKPTKAENYQFNIKPTKPIPMKKVSIDRLIKLITEKGIVNLNESLEYILNISKENDWCLFKQKDLSNFNERFYRRNILVHNKGIPDQNYITKYGSSKTLFVSPLYLLDSLEIFEKYKKMITEYLINYITNNFKI